MAFVTDASHSGCSAKIDAVEQKLSKKIEDLMGYIKNQFETQLPHQQQPIVGTVPCVNGFVTKQLIPPDAYDGDPLAAIKEFLDGLLPPVMIDSPENVDKLENKIIDQNVARFYVNIQMNVNV